MLKRLLRLTNGCGQLVLPFLAGSGATLLLFWLSIRADPYFMDGPEVSSVTHAVIVELLANQMPVGSERLYLDAYLEKDEMQDLRRIYPSLQILPWSERPKDVGCESDMPDVIVLAPCQRDDFLKVDVVSFPLWRTAIVGVGTFNSGGQLFMINALGRWRIIKKSGYVI